MCGLVLELKYTVYLL